MATSLAVPPLVEASFQPIVEAASFPNNGFYVMTADEKFDEETIPGYNIKTFGQPKKAAATTPTPPITTPKTPPKIPRIYGFNLNDLDPARKQSILTYATVGAVKGDKNPVHETTFGTKVKTTARFVSVVIHAADKGLKPYTHHVYKNGTGTMRPGDIPE
ncbi:hypothetical protein E4U44_002236 [Claviceps purpurea]|nr:hypothetical protein E4U44_002236 [Claviceps purpurea]